MAYGHIALMLIAWGHSHF